MTDAGAVEAPAKPHGNEWGRWFGRPGKSLTRRLIWLASAWILVALLVTGVVLTSVFQESALRRLGKEPHRVWSGSRSRIVLRAEM